MQENEFSNKLYTSNKRSFSFRNEISVEVSWLIWFSACNGTNIIYVLSYLGRWQLYVEFVKQIEICSRTFSMFVYLFKTNSGNAKTRCEQCETSTSISGVFIGNFEQISRIALVFLLLTLNKWIPAWMMAVNSQQAEAVARVVF